MSEMSMATNLEYTMHENESKHLTNMNSNSYLCNPPKVYLLLL